MNSKILTNEERRRLKRWLTSGEEDQVLRNLFKRLRKSIPDACDERMRLTPDFIDSISF